MIVNALIGAIITVVSWFIVGPLGSILGGAVAGYLEATNGLTVGGLSGILASLPIALLVPIVGTALVFGPDPLVGLGLLTVSAVFIVSVIVNAVLGALGGYLGVYVNSELTGASDGRSLR